MTVFFFFFLFFFLCKPVTIGISSKECLGISSFNRTMAILVHDTGVHVNEHNFTVLRFSAIFSTNQDRLTRKYEQHFFKRICKKTGCNASPAASNHTSRSS